MSLINGDARQLPLKSQSVDLIITSPPYWQKRDYGYAKQIGQEKTYSGYIEQLILALEECKRVIKSTGSVFINLGDTYNSDRSLAGIPIMFEIKAREAGWLVRNRIAWVKNMGMPTPVRNRLVSRHEYIFHLTLSNKYYYDLFGYMEKYKATGDIGDVWHIPPGRRKSGHMAPFPEELVERIITIASPYEICSNCGVPRERIVKKTDHLDTSRPGAVKAMELAKKYLTPEHIAAIQSFGIGDVNRAKEYQSGAGKSSEHIKKLAREAKDVLGGYFREYTFPLRESVGWTNCKCGAEVIPSVVLDPFCGSGTTITVAQRMGRTGIGIDLASIK